MSVLIVVSNSPEEINGCIQFPRKQHQQVHKPIYNK